MRMKGRCRFCGFDGEGIRFDEWVKPTFTDWDKLVDGQIVCDGCMFYFDEASVLLAEKMGKDKPQKMRNYSHFVVNGEWIPLGKGNKDRMKEILLGESFPELAAIAVSGQKHIVFRAVRNLPGSRAGWVQFEEQRLFLFPDELRRLLAIIEELYSEFSKEEIETGDYAGYRILNFGMERWLELEKQVKAMRGKPIFSLALFLAQRSEENGYRKGKGSSRKNLGNNLEGGASGLQEPVSDEHLVSVRKPGSKRGVHR